MSDPDTILMQAEEQMEKALDYLKQELRGIRTGRATPAMVEFVKVEYYGSMTDLKAIAAISVPEPSQLLIKPFDSGALQAIKSALEKAALGANPMPDGKVIRLNLPAMSKDRREKEVGRMKKMGEETKVVIRNARRDGNKHADQLGKAPGGKHYPEAEIEGLKTEIQDLLKKYETDVDKRIEEKTKEVMTI
jgi:ribosome recycling factor